MVVREIKGLIDQWQMDATGLHRRMTGAHAQRANLCQAQEKA